MENKELQGLSSNLHNTGTVVNFAKLVVEIAPSELFNQLVLEYEKELNRVLTSKRNYVTFDVNKYFKTLLFWHVQNVNSELDRKTRFVASDVEIPAIYSTFLMQIGIVVDKDYGLKLVPKFDIDAGDLYTVEEMSDASSQLRGVMRLGLVLVKGLPLPKNCGNLTMMACSIVENGDVLSYQQGHPVYGFIASIFNFHATTDFLGLNAMRIRYGTLSEFELLIHGIFGNRSSS